MLEVIQRALRGKAEFDLDIAVNQLLEGATEFDIVKSGLEEIMCSSTNEVINTSLKRNVDLRTAAYLNAINRLHDFFEGAGIIWLFELTVRFITILSVDMFGVRVDSIYVKRILKLLIILTLRFDLFP